MTGYNDLADRLARALGRRDEKPNIEMAAELAQSANEAKIAELARLARTSKKPVSHDATKVLYELGLLAPGLITPHKGIFVELLASADNRTIWGSLQALDAIASIEPNFVAQNLNAILDAADRSSVIAKDKTMSILSQLNANARFAPMVSPVMLQRLSHAAANQFPMYAEFAAATMPEKHHSELARIIVERRSQISSPAKLKRLEQTLARLNGATI